LVTLIWEVIYSASQIKFGFTHSNLKLVSLQMTFFWLDCYIIYFERGNKYF